ncbi:MAG: C_GCAxxG_C_C family protein [Mogibacterium sp.]|nr:C_GCAxxG_C_C family protein [Mogibacterium sp.]
MNINAKSIDLAKVQADAEESFRKGFFCCEAAMETIINSFELDVPREVISMASGMAVGVGKSGCICGALNGAILAIGMFFGRSEQKGPADPQVVKCLALTKEMHDWFKDNNTKKITCCRVLTREFDMSKGGHKAQCIYYTGICTAKAAEIIARELGIPTTGEITVLPYDEYIKTRIAPLEA